MKKRTVIISMIILLSLASLMLGGCSMREVKYGTWRLEGTADPDKMEFQKPFFPISIELQEDGTVLMLDKEFGIVTEDRQNYHFEQTSDWGDTKIVQDGAWEIVRGQDQSITLYVYPDNEKVVYKLVRVADNPEQE